MPPPPSKHVTPVASFVDLKNHKHNTRSSASSSDDDSSTFVDAVDALSSSSPDVQGNEHDSDKGRGLSPGDMSASQEIRSRYGLSMQSSMASLAEEVPEGDARVMLQALYSLAGRLVQSTVIENEHPLLAPWCTFLESFLYHGWRLSGGGPRSSFSWSASRPKERDLWSVLLARLEGLATRFAVDPNTSLHSFIPPSACSASLAAVENVRHFTGLARTPAAKVRAWIGLAVMSKCLAADIRLLLHYEPAVIRECYEEGACIRQSLFTHALLRVMTVLDERVDFNLYIREQDIPRHAFPTRRWKYIIRAHQLHLCVVNERCGVEVDTSISSGSIESLFGAHNRSKSQLPDQDNSAEDDGKMRALHRHIATLTDTNRQLRHTIATHLHSLSSAQSDLRRLHSEHTAFRAELQECKEFAKLLSEQNEEFKQEVKRLKMVVSSHEQANASLQRQLSTSTL